MGPDPDVGGVRLSVGPRFQRSQQRLRIQDDVERLRFQVTLPKKGENLPQSDLFRAVARGEPPSRELQRQRAAVPGVVVRPGAIWPSVPDAGSERVVRKDYYGP